MDHAGPPVLTAVTPDDAIAAIVTQNFGRQVHAGAILTITEAIATSVPTLRLTFSDVAAAAEMLVQTDALKSMPAARIARADRLMPVNMAPLGETFATTAIDLSEQFARLSGYTEVETASAIYLASGRGASIQKLNPVSTLIWKLLEDPMTGHDMISILTEIYAEVAPEQLQHDTRRALQFMMNDGMITRAAL
jgi:hypothetical protein